MRTPTKTFPKRLSSFLKLCKIKYYNFSPIYNIQKDFSFQTGDPLGPFSADSDGGSSIWGLVDGPSRRNFATEISPKSKHDERGLVSMSTVPAPYDAEQRPAGSQFLVTLGENLEYLDGKAAIFGKVVEGFDILDKINNAFVDENGRPLKDIRIRHTAILEDPYDDFAGLQIPPESPLPSAAQLATVRIADDEELDEDMDEEAMDRLRREREARAQALTLEMVGDLPFAEVKPPENVLFVCKLNPVTQDEDLQLLFSQFGKILSCEVIRDKRTGDSLQYAFIEFENQKDCEQAFFKMQDVLIDDHRIHVDFSQSVSRLSETWRSATNTKRKRQTGGFGGISSLEKKQHYRAENWEKERGDYGMVFNDKHYRAKGNSYPAGRDGRRQRSRSPRRDGRDRDKFYSSNERVDERKRYRTSNMEKRENDGWKADDRRHHHDNDYHRRR